jgi:cytochrome P450
MSDVHIFKPERWLKQVDGVETYDHQAGPFLTFSLGPRGCFGKKLAYLEMRLILTLLVWNFHFKKFQGELASYETKEGITVMPKHCYVAIEKI